MRAAMDEGRAQVYGMILGIGSDLCDIRRIERSLERFGDRFTHRIFTEGERGKQRPPGRPGAILRATVRRQGGLRKGPRDGAERRASSGATWKWSTCPAAADLPAHRGRPEAARGHDAGGL